MSKELPYRGRDDDDLTEPATVPRCVIPQHDLDDKWLVAETYSLDEIKEACAFKRIAMQGAVELQHIELAKSIQDQIQVLVDAACIRTGDHPKCILED